MQDSVFSIKPIHASVKVFCEGGISVESVSLLLISNGCTHEVPISDFKILSSSDGDIGSNEAFDFPFADKISEISIKYK